MNFFHKSLLDICILSAHLFKHMDSFCYLWKVAVNDLIVSFLHVKSIYSCHGGGDSKCPDKFLFAIAIFFLVGNMPLNFLTFLKLTLWSSRKKTERCIFLGLIVAA